MHPKPIDQCTSRCDSNRCKAVVGCRRGKGCTGRTRSLDAGQKSDGRNSRPDARHPKMLALLGSMVKPMSNVASALKEEISRIARKEIRRETTLLKKSSTTHRSEIAALKRRILELERRLRRRRAKWAASSSPAAANEDSVSVKYALQRKEHGRSTAPPGPISRRMRRLSVGASGQSIYNWEDGKARPRAQHLPAIFALRNLGRRQANEILETRKAA